MSQAAAKSWPKAHLVYYALATLNVMVFVAGLLMSHWTLRGYEEGVRATQAYDRQLVSLRAVTEAAQEANAGVIGSLRSRNVSTALATVKAKAGEIRDQAARLRSGIADKLAGPMAKRFDAITARLDTSLAGMEMFGTTTLSLLAQGREADAITEIGRMQSRYASLRHAVRDLTQFFALVRTAKVEQERRQHDLLRRYALVIGSMIALIIGAVILYGHYLTKLLKLKYGALESALARSREA